MALIQFGDLITGMRGSVGGSTYGNSLSGFTRRNKSNPVQPTSPIRTLVRNQFSSIQKAWRELNDSQRLAWIAATINFPRVNSLGNSYYLSGINLFASMNQVLYNQSKTQISDPPDAYSFPALAIDDLTCDVSATTLLLSYDDSAFANCDFIVKATPCISPGISSPRGNFKFIRKIAGGLIPPANLWSFYTTIFGMPIANTRLFLKVTPFRTDSGQQSTPVIATCIVSA